MLITPTNILYPLIDGLTRKLKEIPFYGIKKSNRASPIAFLFLFLFFLTNVSVHLTLEK